MSNAVQLSPQQKFAVLKQEFNAREALQQFSLALGYDHDDQHGKEEAMRYINSVLMEIEKGIGDKMKDLTGFTPRSIIRCAIDAAQMRLMIDGRQHAHIVVEMGKPVLRVGFRGYIAKVTEAYPDADIQPHLIWNGDKVQIKQVDGFDHYQIERGSAFMEPTPDNLQGVLVVMSYTKGGRQFQHVETVPASEIKRIRGKAKFDGVWKEWFGEKAKAAAIKRATKTVFAGITGLQNLVDYDNKHNFEPLKVADSPKAGSIIDNLNATVCTQVTTEADTQIVEQEESFTEDQAKSLATEIRSALHKCKSNEDIVAFDSEYEVDLKNLRSFSEIAADFIESERKKTIESFS